MDRLFRTASGMEPTYDDIGATIAGLRPSGFRHDHYEVEIGRGATAYVRAVAGLREWKAHAVPGVNVFPKGAEIRVDATVIVTLGTTMLSLGAPCRVVGIIDEEDRWGFAYGTLPGHPEQGEELFMVSRSPSAVVRFEITAFSRPGDRLTKLSGPIGRTIQRKGTESYLGALRRYVAEPSR